MRFYDLALFALVFNMALGFLSYMDLTDAPIGEIEGFGETEITNGQNQIQDTIGENDHTIFSDLQWVVENVRLMISALKTFIVIFANATVFLPVLFKTVLCGSSSCTDLSLTYFAYMIGVLIQFLYVLGIVQFALGKSVDEAR